MTVSTGLRQSMVVGTSMMSAARSFNWLAPLPDVTAIIGPLRALTCSMLFRFFENTASSGAMKMEGKSGLISAMIPCFIDNVVLAVQTRSRRVDLFARNKTNVLQHLKDVSFVLLHGERIWLQG